MPSRPIARALTLRLASRLALALLLLVAVGPTTLHADTPRTVRLTILHTNDTHGHLLPYSYPDTFDPGSDLARLAARRDIGGIARRAALAKQIRREPGHATLLVDAGDICDGTPFSTEFHGDADVAAMNAAGYDLACPGNHEFNNTLDQLRSLIAHARYPVLSANVTTKADGKPVYTPYIIKNIGGARVAFFGLLTTEASTYPAGKTDLNVASPLETARRLVPQLRRQADFVILVSHIGVEEDGLLAKSVAGIDAIIGGHSHTMLTRPQFIPSAPTGSRDSVHGTVIVQNFQWAGTLGRLDLTLYRSETGRWSVRGYAGRLLPVTAKIAEDPATARVVADYWDRIKGKYAEVIGQAEGDFAEKGPDFAEYHLVTDAIRAEMGTEIDIENMGGVRAPLPRGPITFGDLVTMDPFGNSIVTFRVTGRQLKRILTEARPAVSGIRYTLDAGQLVEATVNGQPIEDDRLYTGATNSFLATRLPAGSIQDVRDTGKPRLETVIAYIRARQSVRPAYDGRRVLRHMKAE